jgi:hypothetical protein
MLKGNDKAKRSLGTMKHSVVQIAILVSVCGVAISSVPLMAQPANDICAGAIDITANIDGPAVTGDNSTASPGPSDPDVPAGSPTCHWASNPGQIHHTLWYTFDAPAHGGVTVSVCGSAGTMVDSVIALYDGTCGAFVEVACGEDECGSPGYFSEFTATGLTPGQTYYLLFANTGGWGGSIPGTFSFVISSPPPPFSCPPGAIPEPEPCGADTNGGCNMSTPAFTPIQCGDVYCGTSYAIGVRDTDWYEFIVPTGETRDITVSASAEFAFQLLLIDSGANQNCSTFSVVGSQLGNPNQVVSISQTLTEGIWWFFISPQAFSGMPCGADNEYWLDLTCHGLAGPVEVALNADASCYDVGDAVTVTVDLTGDGVTEIVGGQFFLEYDNSVLGFLDAEPGDTVDPNSPFELEVFEFQMPGIIDYAVGVAHGGSGTSGDATMAVLTFEALQEVCNVGSLVEFRPNMPPTRLSDNFGGEVLPDLEDLDAITIDGTAPTFVTFPSDTSVECDVSMVTLAGTHNITFSYRMFDADTSVLFQPTDDNPVIVTGSVDISGLPNNSSGFMQLISKDRWDEWTASSFGPFVPNTNLFGFIDQAHGAANTSAGGRFGIGQQITTGSVTQNYAGGNNLGGLISGFEIAFGDTEFSGTLNSQTTVRNYETKLDALAWLDDGQANPPTAGNYPLVTDWSSGAYAAIGTFTDGAPGTAIFDVTFSQSNIPGPSITGEPTVDDNCDGNPTVTYSDTIIPGACPETFTIEREWTVTDFCGNSTSQTQTITVIDTTAPQLVGVPSDITVPADAGGCDAIVSITPPTATDNCDPNPVVTYERSDDPMLTLADPFPTGTTTITWFAEDCTGNISTDTTDVTVDPVNVMLVDVSLQNVVSGPFTRCVEFELTDANGNVIEVVAETLSFTNGQALVSVNVPCGAYGGCIMARDPLHTLRSTGDLTIVGTEYDAFNFADLRGGDLNDDGVIDILDFGLYVFTSVNDPNPGADTDCTTVGPHGDIVGDGVVFTADFTQISNNFLQVDDICVITLMAGRPGAFVSPIATPQPRRSVTVRELHEMRLGHLAIADLNNDGIVNETDMALFLAGVRP